MVDDLPERMKSIDSAVEVYLGLGTNLGDREANISEALKRLGDAFGCDSLALSGFYETEPWGFESEDKFLNAAVRYDLAMSPEEILGICKSIERKMGRPDGKPEYGPDGKRIYSSRIVDIDILLYGTETIDLPDLKIPHPLMSVREFVMKPLSEIISDNMRAAFPALFEEYC